MEEPNVEPFEFYHDAFRELSSCRASGFELGPIPFTAIAEYFRIYELIEDFDDFLYFIRVLDDTYLNHHRSKGESNASANRSKGHKN